jgi:phage tail sheath protein FI
LESILPETNAQKLIMEFPKNEAEFRIAFQKEFPNISQFPEVVLSDFVKQKKDHLHLGLMVTSPTYASILEEIRSMMNLLPAAPALAGIYTMVDNSRGVWKSPANVSLNAVIKPAVEISHEEQEDLNVHVSGKSINTIRTFPGVGTLVWGARTLDGNSLDWKYVNVRRTVILLEQSIKLALRAYVFEPNEANTWTTVKSKIVSFLTEKWNQGALAGASPEDAFDVQIGLGATMTGLDILQGKMLVSVKLAIVRPAEFIVITFQQQMQKF